MPPATGSEKQSSSGTNPSASAAPRSWYAAVALRREESCDCTDGAALAVTAGGRGGAMVKVGASAGRRGGRRIIIKPPCLLRSGRPRGHVPPGAPPEGVRRVGPPPGRK